MTEPTRNESGQFVNSEGNTENIPLVCKTMAIGGSNMIEFSMVPKLREIITRVVDKLGTTLVLHGDVQGPNGPPTADRKQGSMRGIDTMVRLALQQVDVFEHQIARNRAGSETHAELNRRLVRDFDVDVVLVFGKTDQVPSFNIGIEAQLAGVRFYDMTEEIESWDGTLQKVEMPKLDSSDVNEIS